MLDRHGSGRVSRRDFRRTLEDLGFDLLGDDKAEEILDHFDPHRSVASIRLQTVGYVIQCYFYSLERIHFFVQKLPLHTLIRIVLVPCPERTYRR